MKDSKFRCIEFESCIHHNVVSSYKNVNEVTKERP